MLTWAQIKTIARKFASDTDTTNPFWSDVNLTVLCESFQVDLASYMRYPRGEASVVPTVVGQMAYDLPTDWLSTVRIVIYNSSGFQSKLTPKTEDDVSEVNPNWRNPTASEYGTPGVYFAANTITPGITLSRKINIYPAPNQIWSILHVYVKTPAAIASDSNIPIFPAPMHVLATYYLAWQMLIGTDQVKADVYKNLYEKERRRMCGEGRKENEGPNIIQFR